MTAQGHEPRASQARTDAYPLQILELGRISYANAWQFQKLRYDSVLEGIVPDTLLLLEHDPVITMGRGGLPEHIYVTEEILAKKGIELFWVERGGMATYHGPGQLVAYPILHLRDRDLHAYMERLLDVLEATVEHFGVKAERSVHGPGLWVNGAKVASIGMAVRKWVSYHGIALNVSLDLSPFSLISPCGNPTERMTSLERECGKKIDLSDVQKVFVDNFLRVFGYYQKPDVGEGHPSWLVRHLPSEKEVRPVEHLVSGLGLHTVCQEAHCPNRHECFARGTSTFLVMGDICTRACRYCAVTKGHPKPLDPEEPSRVAEAVARLGLSTAVITSVTRDDVPDGGAGHFAAIVRAIREKSPKTHIELLVPDFQGRKESIERVCAASPDMFNHNIEAVRRIFAQVRPRADYDLSLRALQKAASLGLRVKSGLMLGLGETWEEIAGTLRDLYDHGCRYLTLGQYLAPSSHHVPMRRYLAPDEFVHWKNVAMDMGFLDVASGPLVRSSYRASVMLERAL